MQPWAPLPAQLCQHQRVAADGLVAEAAQHLPGGIPVPEEGAGMGGRFCLWKWNFVPQVKQLLSIIEAMI